ncbi:hypothetical protein [Nonomuraea typhae]|uniref:DUF3592 domain-containing protein n=1 Tax=Nonomuraea typhae TaxID=2603600 RepID=A0ABW7YQ56_9ACTN
MLLHDAPPRSRPRRLRGLVIVVVPVVLLWALVMTPMWIHDRHLGALADQVRSHPLPHGTRFADDEVQASVEVRGNGNYCDYRLRFNLSSTLPAQQVADHYKAAGVGPAVVVWTPSEPPPLPLVFGDDRLLILEVQVTMQEPGWDLRCH